MPYNLHIVITTIQVIEIIVFAAAAVNTLYLLVFTAAAACPHRRNRRSCTPAKKFAILIPAYREDNVIGDCVRSCLSQDYPEPLFDTVVISDGMHTETETALRRMGAVVIAVNFRNSTKSKALNAAMDHLTESYDLALVLDADNIAEPDFLAKLNDAFCSDPELRIVQAHRRAKNANTSLAVLDAVSEEVNNTIFRLGHANLGLSAALIGSGMCFDYALFRDAMADIDAVGGFDRELELTLLEQGYRIGYLPDAVVLDEKVQHHSDFSRQRRRWMSAQVHYMSRFIGRLPRAIKAGNLDFCDKMFQQMSLPRLILTGLCFIMAVVTSFAPPLGCWKWWVIFAVLVATLLAATPRYLLGRRFLKALVQLPYTFLLMAWNMAAIRGANKKFIHTSHGIDRGKTS